MKLQLKDNKYSVINTESIIMISNHNTDPMFTPHIKIHFLSGQVVDVHYDDITNLEQDYQHLTNCMGEIPY